MPRLYGAKPRHHTTYRASQTWPATYLPVPAKLTDCGDPAALSATSSVAVSAPDAAGLNFTDMVQLAPAATVAPQVVVFVNDDLSVPLRVIPPLLMARVAVPVFFNVTTFAAVVEPTAVLAKVRVLGVSETTGAVAAAPVPLRLTD